MLGAFGRGYHAYKSSRLFKLWYGDPWIHFEAQRLSERWSPRAGPWLEVGLHLESGNTDENYRLLRWLERRRKLWVDVLPEATAGRCYCPRGADWIRVSDLIAVPGLEEDYSASELA